MGLFDFFLAEKNDGRQFVSGKNLENKIAKQLQMTPKTMSN
jgi:hypothetical protein